MLGVDGNGVGHGEEERGGLGDGDGEEDFAMLEEAGIEDPFSGVGVGNG